MSRNLPIMPKEIRPAGVSRMRSTATSSIAPYPVAAADASSAAQAQQRNAAIWSSADDEVLLQARASGLNWQPIAHKYFPNKTPNACRKRHERLIERRHVEEWDHRKLELLAEEYLACRKQMWEILAERVGERWAVVEAKCLEKGLKSLQITARTAHRKASAISQHCIGVDGFDTRSDGGISDHRSDSGIGIGSDAEMEIGEDHTHAYRGSVDAVDRYMHHHQQHRSHPHSHYDPQQASRSSSQEAMAATSHVHIKSSSWHAPETQYEASSSAAAGGRSSHAQAMLSRTAEHIRTRSLPQPLPLYRPPPPLIAQQQQQQPLHHPHHLNQHHQHLDHDQQQAMSDADMLMSPEEDSYMSRRSSASGQNFQRRYSPESNGRGGISIQSVLS